MEKARVSVESAREVAPSESRWRLVLGVDFTSPKSVGRSGGQCLHDLGAEDANPYLQALSILAMLSICGGDGYRCHRPILAYGFGDARTTSRAVFAFSEAGQPLGPVDVAARYRSIAQSAQLGGSRSFAPLIWQAIAQQRETGERQAVLVLACGDLQWSAHQATAQAVAAAAEHGIPVVVLGIGDGPWERIRRLCRERAGIKFAEFGQVASRFPFGRLQAAEEIHRLLAVPAGPPEKTQAHAQSHFESCMPMCPPDSIQGEDVKQFPSRSAEPMLMLNVLLCVAAVLVAMCFQRHVAWLGIATAAAPLAGRFSFRFGISASACFEGLRKVWVCAPMLQMISYAA